MAFADLTAEQQRLLTDFMRTVRPLAGQLARLITQFQAVAAERSNVVGPILSLLQASDPVLDQINLAGAVTMTAFDIGALCDDFASVVTDQTSAARVTRRTEAAGLSNV